MIGREDIRLTSRLVVADVVVERRFADPVMAQDAIRAAIEALIAESATRLAERDHGGRRFDVALFRSDGHVARLSILTGIPTREPAIVSRLLAERIDALADPLDPGFGYDVIRFSVPVTEPLRAAQLTLDGDTVGATEVAMLIDRLTTRLGSSRIRRLARGASHIPEKASHDCVGVADASSWPMQDPGEPPLRPLHMLSSPQSIEVLAEVPDGAPRSFSWNRRRHLVARAEGPERITAEWWNRASGRGKTRDYYRIEDSDGHRFWVFRHGLYAAETASPQWFVHGVFA